MVFGQEKELKTACGLLKFQFPLGIRWCSDAMSIYFHLDDGDYFNSPWELDGVRTEKKLPCTMAKMIFQFPLGIRWCSDLRSPDRKEIIRKFQFPLGIRWCSDYK